MTATDTATATIMNGAVIPTVRPELFPVCESTEHNEHNESQQLEHYHNMCTSCKTILHTQYSDVHPPSASGSVNVTFAP